MVRYYWYESLVATDDMADLELDWLECYGYVGHSIKGALEFHVPSDYPSGTTVFRVERDSEVRASGDYNLTPGQVNRVTYTGSTQTYVDDDLHFHYYESTTNVGVNYARYGLGDPWDIGSEYKYKGQSGWAQFVKDHFKIHVYSGNVNWWFENENDDNSICVWVEADGSYEIYIGFDLWENYYWHFSGIRYIDVDVIFYWRIIYNSDYEWQHFGPFSGAYYYYAGVTNWWQNVLIKTTSGSDTNIIVPTVACWYI